MFLCGRNNVHAVHGVQPRERRFIEVQQRGNLVKTHHLVHHHGVQRRKRRRHIAGENVVFSGELHQVGHRHESRDVIAGFTRQEKPDLPEVSFAPAAANRAVHVAGTGIVRGQREVPIVVQGVQSTEVFAGRLRAAHRVPPLIDVRIDAQALVLGRRIHELPQTAGTGMGAGHRIQAGLHHCEVLQFQGEAVAIEGFFKKGKVARSATEHGAEVLLAFAGVKGDARMNHRIPSEVQRRSAVEPIHAGTEGGCIQCRGFALFEIVDVQQAGVRRKAPVLIQVAEPRQFCRRQLGAQ